jgi:hypothetical protein
MSSVISSISFTFNRCAIYFIQHNQRIVCRLVFFLLLLLLLLFLFTFSFMNEYRTKNESARSSTHNLSIVFYVFHCFSSHFFNSSFLSSYCFLLRISFYNVQLFTSKIFLLETKEHLRCLLLFPVCSILTYLTTSHSNNIPQMHVLLVFDNETSMKIVYLILFFILSYFLFFCFLSSCRALNIVNQ